VHDGGEVAYVIGNYDEVIAAKDGKTAPETLRCHFLARWEKNVSGTWTLDRFFVTPMPRK
jgi:hypothetical protein